MDLRSARFLNSLYSFNNPLSEKRAEIVRKLIASFSHSCMVDGDERLLDEALENVNVRMLNEYVLVALIRLTGPYRDELHNFRRLINFGIPELDRRGIDVEVELAEYLNYIVEW